MKYDLENLLPYALLVILALAVFYGIYFAKMLAQKRRGIQTRQIGCRKEKSIHTVEVLMGIATLCTPAAQLLSIVFGWSCLPANRHLAEIDQSCNERMEIIISDMAKQECVTEALKASDQMEWVRRMNSIRSRAEEIVLTELVYE